MSYKFSAIILAAGFSSRMGSIKSLLPFGDRTMIEQTVSLYKNAAIEDIRVVVGHEKKKILPVLNKLKVKATDNPDFGRGMFSSVLSGLSSLGPDSDACFIHPVDIPLVKKDTIVHLRDVYQQMPGKILRPSFEGVRGHPPLLPSACFRDILSWNGKGGLKTALSQFESNTITLEVPDSNILFDIDTPEDYKTALKKSVANTPP